jgi:DNA-binding CsgD family transcriptional regulator
MTRKPTGTPAGRRKVPARSKPHGEAPHPLEPPPRKTGIRAMGDMPWGTHICVFYDTKNDLLETNASYIEAGLSGNEFCVWAVSEPTSVGDAEAFLRQNIAEFDRYQAAGQLEILPGYDWYLRGDEFDPQRITGGWRDKLRFGLSNGFDGMRVSGNAFWMEAKLWNEFLEYELELDRSISDQKMIVMCTYSLHASRAIDLLDVTRAHNCTVARRGGDWEFLESPELRQARAEIKKLRGGMDVLSKPFPGHERLTPQERVVLAQVVRGASSREASRTLGLSPRTVEFHRMNIMQKLGAKNVADLLLIVLAEH